MDKKKLAKEFLQQLGDVYRIGAVSFPTGGCVPNDDAYDANIEVLQRLMPRFNAQAQESLNDKAGPFGTKIKGNMKITSEVLHSLNVLSEKTKMAFPEGAEDEVVIEFVERFNAAMGFFNPSKSEKNGDAPKKVGAAVLRYGDNLLKTAQNVLALEDDEDCRKAIKTSFANRVLNSTTKVHDLIAYKQMQGVLKKDPHVLDVLRYEV